MNYCLRSDVNRAAENARNGYGVRSGILGLRAKTLLICVTLFFISHFARRNELLDAPLRVMWVRFPHRVRKEPLVIHFFTNFLPVVCRCESPDNTHKTYLLITSVRSVVRHAEHTAEMVGVFWTFAYLGEDTLWVRLLLRHYELQL